MSETKYCLCGHPKDDHTFADKLLNSPCQEPNCKCQIFNGHPIPTIPVMSKSGNIIAVGFNPATDTMVVEFKAGVSYWYYISGMRDQYQEFEKTFDNLDSSTGSMFHKVFRNVPFFGKVEVPKKSEGEKGEERGEGSPELLINGEPIPPIAQTVIDHYDRKLREEKGDG